MSQIMSRLDDIERRNRDAQRWTPMTYFKVALALFIVVMAVVAYFTSPDAPPPPAPAVPSSTRVHGVLLR